MDNLKESVFFLPCGFQRSNSECHAWCQVSLPCEPFCQAMLIYMFLKSEEIPFLLVFLSLWLGVYSKIQYLG